MSERDPPALITALGARAWLCPETQALPEWKTGRIWFDLCVGKGVVSSAVLCCG